MQCTSCQFENMPGVALCGRCGARLGLSTATVDVHPPRAALRVKRLRRWFPWYGLVLRSRDSAGRLRSSVAQAWAGLRRSVAAFTQMHLVHRGKSYPVRRLLVRMIVPGWPQIFTGHPVRGALLLGAFLGLLVLGILRLGTDLGTSLLVLALAIHAASIIDILYAATVDPQVRVIHVVAFAIVFGMLVYPPIFWVAMWLLVPARR